VPVRNISHQTPPASCWLGSLVTAPRNQSSVILRKREGDHCVTQHRTLARVAAKAVYDVLAAVDDINGGEAFAPPALGTVEESKVHRNGHARR